MSKALRTLAFVALQQYGIDQAHLKLLSKSENSVYRVDAQARYTLRVYHPDLGAGYVTNLSTPAIQSELLWLRLLHEAGLGVPEPVTAQNGAQLIEVSTSQIPDGRRCTLYRWVDGRFRDKSLTPDTLEAVGVFIAQMHNVAAAFTPPPHFSRYRWDWAREFAPDSPLMTDKADILTAGQRTLFRRAADVVGETMTALGETPAHFGLIHSDLHEHNYLFHGKEVRAIDFAEFGWGYYLFDLAVALYFLRDRPDYGELRAAILRGYSRLRDLPPDLDNHLAAFLVMRAIDLVNYIIDDEQFRTSENFTRWTNGMESAVRRFARL